MDTLDENTHPDEFDKLLRGRKVVKVLDNVAKLDNGTFIHFVGHVGGCSCSAGDYGTGYTLYVKRPA